MSSTASFASNNISGARATYCIRSTDVSKILCHRHRNGDEQYLVRWRTEPEYPVPPRAICSWHDLSELRNSLHHVQAYIEHRRNDGPDYSGPHHKTSLSNPVVSRKRKAPGLDPQSRDGFGSGLPTPSASAHLSRENSVISISSSTSAASDAAEQGPEVYNGVLQRKAGYITAKKSRDAGVVAINTTRLPTAQMLEVAASTPVSHAERLIRKAFFRKLKGVKNIRLENTVDTTTPSLNFDFIDEFVLRDGVVRADPETNVGCQKPCRPNMGQNIGCEYPKQCSCLEYAAVNEPALQREDQALFQQYMQVKAEGKLIDTTGMPKRFPYHKPKQGERIPMTLTAFYRDERYPIYECSQSCNCGPGCKTRLVQKGRKVPLTIFKTRNRGWGVKCDEDLVQGEFIDTYLGEVITNDEAELREGQAGKDKASYLYSLDKFVGDDDELTTETCHVVDGQYKGGPTRFINHSCEPNCRQYTVSYNRYELWVYDLAFFAIEDIPAGTELTFDYLDQDEEEEEVIMRKREEAANDPKNHDKKPCNCGARRCRGLLWV